MNNEILRYVKENFSYCPKTGILKNSEGKAVGSKCHQGYLNLYIYRFKKTLLAHRLCWFLFYGKLPEKNIDHINGNKSDNRIENLREATNRENQWNQKIHRDGKIPNISIRDGKFRTHIKHKRVQYEKSFKTLDEAIKWRDQKLKEFSFR